MRRWLRRMVIAASLIALMLGALYEGATHVGRGWIHGEAFYEGRPTSYWRARCDNWLGRFDTTEDAVRFSPPGIAVPFMPDDEMGFLSPYVPPRPESLWKRTVDRFLSSDAAWREDWPPNVLFGFPGSEPVLEELAKEPTHRALAERGLRYAKVYRAMGHTK